MQDQRDDGSYSLFETPPSPEGEAAAGSEFGQPGSEGDPDRHAASGADVDALAASVLITGASGLIGSHVAARFREMGWNVRALIRPSSDASFLEELGCEFVVGDLTDPDSMSGAAEGCEVVIHAAAQLGAPASMEQHVEVNVEGTRRILKEALRAGARRFVHVSSVAVYGAPTATDELPLGEDVPLDHPIPDSDHYSLTKRVAEEVVRKAERRIEWCILRPDMVMGERDRLFTPRVLRWASRPVLACLGSGGSDLPLVYAGNVAHAVWLAATREKARWRTYNVTDDGTLTQKTLLRMAAGRGPDAPVLPLPARLVGLAARISKAVHRILPRSQPLGLTPNRIRLFTEGDPYDGSLIVRELGWTAAVSTEEGWRRAIRWYESTRSADRGIQPMEET